MNDLEMTRTQSTRINTRSQARMDARNSYLGLSSGQCYKLEVNRSGSFASRVSALSKSADI